MSKVSILIPARAENRDNLFRTIQSIHENATGDYEIIVGFDGEPYIDLTGVPSTKSIRFPNPVGIKSNINSMVAMATGKYIYKSDAHCSFSKGFDEVLQEEMQEDWIVMPRFKILNGADWSLQMKNGQEEFYDYFYLCCPVADPKGFRFKAGGHWPERTQERLLSHPSLDETPQIHGSGYFMSRDYYLDVLNGFPLYKTRTFHAQEPIWLALRTWLKGGSVMVNKGCWYAHLHQQSKDRGYSQPKEDEVLAYKSVAEHWMHDKEHDLVHDINWFVNTKFPHMPTWPDNWKELLEKYDSNK